MTIAARIKKGKNTAKHGAWLSERGYAVTDESEAFIITAKGTFRETLDLSGPDKGVAVLKEVVANGDLLSYSTRITFDDGKVLTGIPAATRLGPASALMAKPRKSEPKPETGSVYDAI